MNPIFIAHLVADFLLQPKWLAQWKQKSLGGIAFHGLMHVFVLFILVLPSTPKVALLLVALAIIHGLTDHFKVKLQRSHKSFEPMFLLDQAVHLAVLGVFSMYVDLESNFWHTTNGVIGLKVLWFLSFAVAMWNLRKLPAFPIKTPYQTISRFAAITIVFTGFGLAGFFV